MGRPLRITVPNLPFHILARENNYQVVFQKEDEKKLVKLINN